MKHPCKSPLDVWDNVGWEKSITGSLRRPLLFWSDMTYREMRQIVADNPSTTQTAQAFRRAFGLPLNAKRKTDYKRLMNQRIGALDRVK